MALDIINDDVTLEKHIELIKKAVSNLEGYCMDMLNKMRTANDDFTSINFTRALASVSRCRDAILTMNNGMADLLNYLDALNALVQEYVKVEPNVDFPIVGSYER